jgi:hypothetical protein
MVRFSHFVYSFCLILLCNVQLSTSAVLNTTAQDPRASILYQFPKGTYVENLAVRSNGNIVVVLLTQPEVWEINPSVSPATARMVHRFQTASRCTGIIETKPDVFAVLAGKMALELIPQSWEVAEINFGANPPSLHTVTQNIKGAGMLNGLTLLNENAVLVSDTMKGVVRRVDLRTGEHEIVMGGPEKKRIPALGLGLNGIRTSRGSVWMSNTAKKGISKVPVDKQTGRPTGAAEVIGSVSWVDDFVISPTGDAVYVTSHDQHALIKVNVRNGSQTVLAGGPKSGLMVGPTSAVFGRTPGLEKTIYVSTAGITMYPFKKAPDNGPGGGKVIAVTI